MGQLFHMQKTRISFGHFGMESVPDPLYSEEATWPNDWAWSFSFIVKVSKNIELDIDQQNI